MHIGASRLAFPLGLLNEKNLLPLGGDRVLYRILSVLKLGRKKPLLVSLAEKKLASISKGGHTTLLWAGMAQGLCTAAPSPRAP